MSATRRGSGLLWAGLAAAIALGAAMERFPLPDAADRLDRIPAYGPGFVTRPLGLTDAERKIFGAARAERRLVAMGSATLALTVIDGTRNRHAVHDPGYCFRGAGWTVRQDQPFRLPDGAAARRALLEKAGSRREVLYFFSDGTRRFSAPAQGWAASAGRRLTFGASGGAIVFVLIQTTDDRAPDWSRVLRVASFLLEL